MSKNIVSLHKKDINFQSNFNKLPIKTRLEIDAAFTKREVLFESIF